MQGIRKALGELLDPVAGAPAAEEGASPVPAAVIVPIVAEGGEGCGGEVLFTLRSAGVKDHKGQVSFPGGVFEARDGSLLETALRETQEETGIGREEIGVAGRLAPYTTITGYRIFPFVGLLDARPEIRASGAEIERCFFVPLSFLRDEANRGDVPIVWEGMPLTVPAIRWEGMVIWGATFNILMDLVRRMREAGC